METPTFRGAPWTPELRAALRLVYALQREYGMTEEQALAVPLAEARLRLPEFFPKPRPTGDALGDEIARDWAAGTARMDAEEAARVLYG